MRLEKHPAVGCFLRAAPSIEPGKGKQFRALRSDFETAFAVEGMALEGTEFAIRPTDIGSSAYNFSVGAYYTEGCETSISLICHALRSRAGAGRGVTNGDCFPIV